MRCTCAIVVLCLSMVGAAGGFASTGRRTMHSTTRPRATAAGVRVGARRITSRKCAVGGVRKAARLRIGGAVRLLGDRRVESVVGQNPAGLAEAFPFTGRLAGQALSIHVYVDRLSHAKSLMVALYSDAR